MIPSLVCVIFSNLVPPTETSSAAFVTLFEKEFDIQLMKINSRLYGYLCYVFHVHLVYRNLFIKYLTLPSVTSDSFFAKITKIFVERSSQECD